MKRRAFLATLALGAVACRSHETPPAQGSRIVSLSPGFTDALFAIRAGPSVVARSDYCDYPPEVSILPRVGSSITPNYEAIARLRPTLIVSEDNAATRRRELEALARTLLLRWLSLDEVVGGIRELGRVTGFAKSANALADRLARKLGVPPPPAGPRVLLIIGSDTGKLDELWFISKNSLQGAALHAAGARNAVAEDVRGQPRLPLERLVALDPDAIVVLALRERAGEAELAPYKKLTALKAVRNAKLAILDAPEAYVTGPRVLALVDRLSATLRRLQVTP